METKAGTPNYISPEVLAGNYGVECDMWFCSSSEVMCALLYCALYCVPHGTLEHGHAEVAVAPVAACCRY